MARRRLSGSTVLVTGPGGDLGRAIALRFAAAVDVMVVCPSFVATRIDRNALGGDGLPARHAQVTVGRPLAPAVVADRICAGALRGRRLPLIGRTARAA